MARLNTVLKEQTNKFQVLKDYLIEEGFENPSMKVYSNGLELDEYVEIDMNDMKYFHKIASKFKVKYKYTSGKSLHGGGGVAVYFY